MTEETKPTTDFDIVVIGGGINGAGIARDATGRGLSVMLCEKDDIAQHTSSSSTKLIHGGLRYLEHYDFMLVRHALQEREVLLRMAPHIIWPLRFILPHHKSLRPRWMMVDLEKHIAGNELKNTFDHGFEYSDCWVQDARLVVLNLIDAEERGCDVRIRTEVTDLTRLDDHWKVQLRNHETGSQSSVTAKVIVNASGPWVDKTLDLDAEHDARYSTRLVKGSHIVVPKLYDHPYTYIFQHTDGRVLFAIPYEENYTLLGTTDMEIKGDPGDVSIEQEETDYICTAVSEYFRTPIKSDDVVWSYAGVRPLYDDASTNASKVTRDYKLDLDVRKNVPVLSVYGGKITTYRKLADQAVDMLSDHLAVEKSDWTATTALPGGDIPNADFDAYAEQKIRQYNWLDEKLVRTYTRDYGTRIDKLLSDCKDPTDLGQHFGGSLYQREVDYLIDCEWAKSSNDILWRRTKKGLTLTSENIKELDRYLESL